MKKKFFVLFLPNCSSVSLRNRTKLEKSLESIRIFCKWKVVFRNTAGLGDVFHFGDCSLKVLFLVSFVSLSVNSAMNAIVMNVWRLWMLELANILLYYYLQKRKLKLAIAPNVIFCYFTTIRCFFIIFSPLSQLEFMSYIKLRLHWNLCSTWILIC